MKKFFNSMLLLGLTFGLSVAMYAQIPGNAPMPPQSKERKRMPGKPGEMRGMRDGKRGMRGGERGMHRGFGMPDEDIYRLNLTDAQKIKLFDFRKQMMTDREAQMTRMRGAMPTDADREEMRKLMEAKRFGTLTPEQDAKIKAFEAKMKSNMEERRQKSETAHQAFLNIFTADQRAQLQKFETDRQQKRAEMRRNMPKPPIPPNPPTPNN